MDLSIVISGLVTISLFFLLHFVVSPTQENRRTKTEQLTNLYAPLYGLLLARIEIGLKISPKEFTLGNIKNHDFLAKENVDQMIYNNLGYASIDLISVWSKYTSTFGKIDFDLQLELVKVATKDFNRLRKDLRLPYNKSELESGIPEMIRHLV